MNEHTNGTITSAPDKETFADFFAELLRARGLSQRQAAILLKVSDSQVSRWQHGVGGISLDSVDRIASTFNLGLDPLARLAGLRNGDGAAAAGVGPLLDAERRSAILRACQLMEEAAQIIRAALEA